MVSNFTAKLYPQHSEMKKMGQASSFEPHKHPGRGKFGRYLLDTSNETESSPSPKSRAIRELSAKFDRKMGLPSNPCIEISSDFDEEEEEERQGQGQEQEGGDHVEMYDGFDIQGVSKEELAAWSRLAPVDQKLMEIEDLSQESQSGAGKARRNTSTTKLNPLTTKSINHFVRRHPFFTQQSLSVYKTSQRRTFERDVYDFVRAQGLSKTQAKVHIIKAREMCGEEEYNSEDSALGDEVDDTKEVLRRLSVPGGLYSMGEESVPSIESKEVLKVPPDSEVKAGPLAMSDESSPRAEESQVELKELNVESGDGESSSRVTKRRKSRQASLSKGQETPLKLDKKRVSDSKPEIQESKVARQNSVAAADKQADQGAEARDERKAERRARKRAKRKMEKNDLQASEISAEKTTQEPDNATQNEIMTAPITGPNDPKSEAEAHQNFVKSQQRDPHEHGPSTKKSEQERREAEKRSASFDVELRAARDLANEHAIDLYSQGKYKGASKEFREEMKTMAAERQAREKDKEKADSGAKKRKKRNSATSEKTLDQTGPTKKKRKSNGDAKPRDPSISKKAGFRSPMIQ